MLVFSFGLSSCMGGIVGGECKYKTLATSAVVKAVGSDFLDVEFSTEVLVNSPDSHQVKLRRSSSRTYKVGDILPARIKLISKGSCSPVYYEIAE